MNAEVEYLKILEEILDSGVEKSNRTKIDTINLFGRSIRHNYQSGFPLLTTKKLFVKGILVELLWFLKGTEDPQFLLDNGVHIWDEWMQEVDGKPVLPHTYGVKWRNFYGFDQVKHVVEEIKNNPDSRRMLVSAWDANNLSKAALPWCHVLWQVDVVKDKEKNEDGRVGDISISVYQRSADWFLG